ncbi:MAG: lipoate--protein ligase family protein [Gemmataceae bacterium]
MPHGEWKTRDGKLVTVDLTVAANRLTDVRVRGDFFVHPEPRTNEIILGMESALTGLPADLDDHALAAHIAAAIPFGTELIGTSPEAIALAVRRARTGESQDGVTLPFERVGALASEEIDRLTQSWKLLPWRLLRERPLPPALNVALDEVLTDRVARAISPPILRFWRWQSPAIIIGRCQSVTNEVDLAAAQANGIEIVRRMTGGGAMFLQPHGAITYSLILPESHLAGLSIRLSYEVCESWLIRGLRDLGADAHHVPINDIACSAGKIGGAAQARRAGVILHHTTLAYDMDPGLMVSVLRIGREKLKDKAVSSAQKRVSPLVGQIAKPREFIVDALFESFRRQFGGAESEISDEEMRDAERLVSEKYGTREWTESFE